jgi:hypothetical protein
LSKGNTIGNFNCCRLRVNTKCSRNRSEAGRAPPMTLSLCFQPRSLHAVGTGVVHKSYILKSDFGGSPVWTRFELLQLKGRFARTTPIPFGPMAYAQNWHARPDWVPSRDESRTTREPATSNRQSTDRNRNGQRWGIRRYPSVSRPDLIIVLRQSGRNEVALRQVPQRGSGLVLFDSGIPWG